MSSNMNFFLKQSLLFLLSLTFPAVFTLSPVVHTLGGPSVINHETPSLLKKTVDIYCYPGVSKNLLALWQTVKFNIKIQNDEFNQYLGSDPQEVFKDYTEDNYSWSALNPFQKKSSRSVSVNFFNSSCMAINTKHKHTIELQVIRVDMWRVILMCAGIALIFTAKKLCGNPLFFYICGILIGISASFMLVIYYFGKLIPKRNLTYCVLIGGWTIGVYIFQQIWENIQQIVLVYQTYVFWYTIVTGFLSFLVCYRIGPLTDVRSKTIVMWIMQFVGVLMIFFSSEYKEAATAIIVLSLIIKYFPKSLQNAVLGYWRRKFPPKRRLLTDEEYYEEGARETKGALENLRKYCNSPDCHQWRIMLKLKDFKRFANFVEGDSHLSDSEVLNYEAYAFSPEKLRSVCNDSGTRHYNLRRSANNSCRSVDDSRASVVREDNALEISDDESLSNDSDGDL